MHSTRKSVAQATRVDRAFGLPEEEVLALARRHVGEAKRVTGAFYNGWNHLGYEIDGAAILKLTRPGAPEDELRRDAFMLARLAGCSELPVPRLLGDGRTDGGLPYLCMTRVPGVSLHSLEQAGRPWPEDVRKAMGRFVARFHDLSIDAFRGCPFLKNVDIAAEWRTGLGGYCTAA